MALEQYRLWKRNNADVGCVFARYMAAKPTEFGQRAEVVTGTDPAAVANAIAARVTAFVDEPQVVAGALVLEDVADLPSIVSVALALATHSHWRVTRTIIRGTPAGDAVAFNIVRDIPMQSSMCPSEALVLGPFPEFPKTRQAPVTALEIFVGAPPTHKHSGVPTTKVHLADVPIELPAASVFNNMWASSVAARLQSLGGVEDARAKARVAFAIPMALATSLGCVP
ncbi:MAG: hypothetical protein F9K40_02515 [Kofleriaceae bacterium]|nr:MAG: hypothetical protein F9K40_02515 [Kofleriaceae bacterium]